MIESAISTACLYPLETEKSLEKLLLLGFKRFEVFCNCESEFSRAFFDDLTARVKSASASINSVHLFTCGLEPYMFFSNYCRRYNDSLEQYRRYFAQAAGIGARFVVFHGDRKDSFLSIPEYCERYAGLYAAAKHEGVILAQENVSRCRSGKTDAIREMKNCLGEDIKFVLDVKQAVRADESPYDMCDAMGDSVVLVHISDHSREQDCLLPGAGQFDIKKLKNQLEAKGYDGCLTIEVYRNCFETDEELIASKRFLDRIISR